MVHYPFSSPERPASGPPRDHRPRGSTRKSSSGRSVQHGALIGGKALSHTSMNQFRDIQIDSDVSHPSIAANAGAVDQPEASHGAFPSSATNPRSRRQPASGQPGARSAQPAAVPAFSANGSWRRARQEAFARSRLGVSGKRLQAGYTNSANLRRQSNAIYPGPCLREGEPRRQPYPKHGSLVSVGSGSARHRAATQLGRISWRSMPFG